MKQSSQLTVYMASAGSGKTFTIAIRYIELLINKPHAYRETLAVTFTNKATEEMKTRILSQLYGLSHGLKDSQSYMNRIVKDLGLSENEVRKRAGEALRLILHDYSMFNVETIDAFFQRVLRNLAFELGLTAKLRVELNNEEIEELAVDRLISELNSSDPELKWITGYIEQKTEDNENWKVIQDIKKFGLKIFIQEYKDNESTLNRKFEDPDFFPKYVSSLRKIIVQTERQMVDSGNRFMQTLAQNGYSLEDFSRGSTGVCGYFVKLSKGFYYDTPKVTVVTATVKNGFDDESAWLRKSQLGTPIASFVASTLMPMLNEVEDQRQKSLPLVFSSMAILRNINELRLLNKIKERIGKLNFEDNRFLLADTQDLLSDLMKDSDMSFVYEKIGGRISNIMIDEFQDTSTIQWKNFKKLLLNNMSQTHSQNLIVGDVKQSIYRWRNGDWKLLNNIEDDKDMKDKQLTINILDTNFRSERNIITFNNHFFVRSACLESERLRIDDNPNHSVVTQIFSPERTQQNIPPARGSNGLVDICLLPPNEYDEACMQLTKEYIMTLLSNGAREQDIAILVRDNTNICKLANWLKKEIPDHNFISDEAFRLGSSTAVNVIINAMTALLEPQNILVMAQLAKLYNSFVLNSDADISRYNDMESIEKSLPKAFTRQKASLLSLSLSDVAEQLFNAFELYRITDEAAYINSFFDQISAFTRNNIPDIQMFLEKWEDSLSNKTVLGGDLKGIRLLTIHKSKGLEFDHVIIPYCDWDVMKDGIIWCSTSVKPFSDMPVMPININKARETVFADHYHDENLQRCIDNLNLLYVAFTRAVKNLFVIAKNPSSGKKQPKEIRSILIQDTIKSLQEELPGCSITITDNDKDITEHFTYGDLYINNETAKHSDNVFLQSKELINVALNEYDNTPEFRQSNRSRTFVSGDDTSSQGQQYITLGTVMHSVLSQIHDATDVDHVLDDFVNEGVISETDTTVSKQKLSSLIKNRIEQNDNPIVAQWFDPGNTLYNECSILTNDLSTGTVKAYRPDRVVRRGNSITVIDFKFGNSKEAHTTQVKGYMSLLSQMGYTDIQGYLWYVYKNEIQQIEQ